MIHSAESAMLASMQIVTEVRGEPGLVAWLVCAALCLVGLWPCAPLPLCARSCRDVTHRCPACRASQATVRAQL